MTDHNAIDVRQLAKRYQIGASVERHDTLSESLVGGMKRAMRFRQRWKSGSKSQEFWALRDVSFSVAAGEAVGIIGRNGAGKSTLLKVLSRVTEPTQGSATIRGRVGSLLEVGTGFHPELTGRENVFLNGAILGMKRAEIEERFDSIISFAGLDAHIDTPIKRYSSGMYVRLAFAVASHLDPDVLIVDEVLAVGDLAFQRKCLGRMGEVASSGRTVLLVSHNMSLVRQLCDRCILIDQGRLIRSGPTDDVIGEYLEREVADSRMQQSWENDQMPGDESASLVAISLGPTEGESRSEFVASESIRVEIKYRIHRADTPLRVGFAVINAVDGTYVFYSCTDDRPEYTGCRLALGTYTATAEIPGLLLNVGEYLVAVSGGVYGAKEVFTGIPKLRFTVSSVGAVGDHVAETRKGVVRPELRWKIDGL